MHATLGEAAPPAPEKATPNAARPRWNKLKQTTKTSQTFQNGGKQRIKRLSKVMKARHNETAVTIHVDEVSGRRYSCNEATGHTQWLSGDDDDVKHMKTLFRKFVDDDDDAYYENVETGEVVWDLPEDGELAEL